MTMVQAAGSPFPGKAGVVLYPLNVSKTSAGPYQTPLVAPSVHAFGQHYTGALHNPCYIWHVRTPSCLSTHLILLKAPIEAPQNPLPYCSPGPCLLGD